MVNKEEKMEEVLKEPLHVDCACGSEILRVQYDKETESYDVAIFTLDIGNLTFKNKLRYIWKVLKGEPYGDRMVIEKKNMEKLKEYISEQ